MSRSTVVLSLVCLLGCGAPAAGEAPARVEAAVAEPVLEKVDVKALPKIYDEGADGAALLAAALESARAGDRRVLVTIGGNWCSWCHKLHMLFERDPAIHARLQRSFVELRLDSAAHADTIARFGAKVDGVPFLVVLDAKGEVLARQETGSLELGPRHDPAKVLAFLDGQAAT